MLFNILEVVGFIYFHDSIIQVVKMLILLIFGLAFLLLGYVFFGNLDKKFPFWNFLRKKNDN